MPALLAFLLLCLPLITFAQEGFVPLVGVPFIDNVDVGGTASTRLAGYANAFYIAAISLGAVVAVLKIIWAGVKYMLSDVITDKTQAKADIKGALLGLILIIGAVLMLNTISPNITALQAFNLTALEITLPEPQTRPAENEAEFCSTAEYCERCASENEFCATACAAKNGTYSNEFRSCAHNQDEPGLPIDEVAPELEGQIEGSTIELTNGRAQVDEAIAEAEASGRTVITQTGAYPSQEGHSTRIQYIETCIADGGTEYQVFYSAQNSVEMFVCYQ